MITKIIYKIISIYVDGLIIWKKGGITMKYCLKIIKKDGNVTKHYFSSYKDLDYNAIYCQFSTNIVKAIGLRVGLFKNKILFEVG